MGRVFLVLLAALAMEFAGSLLLYEQTSALLPTSETLDNLAGRLARVRRVLSSLTPADRAAAARGASGDGLELTWAGSDAQVPNGATPDRAPPLPLVLLQSALVRLRPELAEAGLSVRAGSQSGGLFRQVAGTVRLDDGSAMRFSADRLVEGAQQPYRVLISVALFAGGVLLASAMVVHTLTAPLRRLARVAGVIGPNALVAVADDKGPREVRQVARALNAMQARLAAMVNDRTEALAAVSHDLRTPIARMRLRLGLLAGEEGAAMEADLEEMEGMISSVLAYLAGEAEPEPRRTVDLASIVQTLVDDAEDRGAEITYLGPDQCRIQGRPLELKRAFGNLLDNARKYAGAATVSLTAGAELDERAAVRVRVEDRGPGIPEGELERVMGPFQRVDTSRNAGTGGIGLGLAIVRRAAERDGGQLLLRNRPGGGLCAEVLLPVDADRSR